MTRQPSKADLEKQKVLAFLDQADKDVPANPGIEISGAGGDFEALFTERMKRAGFQSWRYCFGNSRRGPSGLRFWSTSITSPKVSYRSMNSVLSTEARAVKPVIRSKFLIDRIENENGMIGLSKNKADMMKAWSDISKAAENEEVIERCRDCKGQRWLERRHRCDRVFAWFAIDLRPVRNMDQYIGQEVTNSKSSSSIKNVAIIVLSRRALLEEERESLRTQTLDQIKEGSVVTGIVKNITDYGAFIDLGEWMDFCTSQT